MTNNMGCPYDPGVQRYTIDSPTELVFNRTCQPPTATLLREGDIVIVVRGPGWPAP